MLYVETEFDDISISHDISFTLGAKKAGFSHGFFGAEAGEIVVITDLSGDKTAFEISVDGAGGFGGCGALFDGPGATFFLAGGEERLETERVVGGFDEFFEGVMFYAV